MDHILSRESDFEVDLESCSRTSGEVRSTNSPLDAKAGDVIFTSVCNGDVEELSKAENGSNMNSNIKDGDELTRGSVRVFIDKTSLVEKKTSKEKRKSTSAKKPPKPPRPPRGLSLDAADQKLIKEIAELANIKRARIERMKALKELKVAKASSTSLALNGSSIALLFTVFFFFVLLFKGISYKSSAMSFHDYVQSGRERDNRFLIVQDNSNLSTSTAILAGFDKVEQASGLTHENSLESVAS
ncbi:putative myb-related protein-like [Capsicum annuum]|uniref:uncharacterized protein LOC107871217 n=1 Tax=Capsicum annuum TaxID=4072 RepID=UPI0007BFE3EC|nr:uncharacterized protein LOC107871217 [Capsicum annuum]KAF3656918.1 putative myb-related protein-like [Capsicum annuum]KAF3657139.1 putative myb-related protein-like [Capsicum annuum]